MTTKQGANTIKPLSSGKFEITICSLDRGVSYSEDDTKLWFLEFHNSLHSCVTNWVTV